MAQRRMRSTIDCRPRFATQRTPDRMTLGPRVGQIAEILGKPLMPWQRELADVALEVVPADTELGWKLAYDDVTVVVMRQQGKTELTFPLMVHRATGFRTPQEIRYIAQTGYQSRQKWEDIHLKRLDESPFKRLYRARKGLNREMMLWTNGSAWGPASPTGKASGTGDSLDLGVIDEAWSRPDGKTELGLRPAMLTRANKQLWRVSMVPGPTRARLADPKRQQPLDSAYLRAAMRRGQAAVRNGVTRGMCYFEFGAADGLDAGDPATWWSCMPALGHTIGEEAIASDYNALDLVDFEAEYLSRWPDDHVPTWTTIKEPTWRALRNVRSTAHRAVAVAADCTEDRTLGYLGVAGRTFDGNMHVEVIEPGYLIPLGTVGVEWMYDRLVAVIDKQEPIAIVVDPKGPANFLIPLLKRDGFEVITPNIGQVEGACGRFFDATGQEVHEYDPETDDAPPMRLSHIGQPELDRAVAAMRKLSSPTTGTFRWARVASVGNVSPLYVVTLAMHGYEVKALEDYDVLDSVG